MGAKGGADISFHYSWILCVTLMRLKLLKVASFNFGKKLFIWRGGWGSTGSTGSNKKKVVYKIIEPNGGSTESTGSQEKNRIKMFCGIDGIDRIAKKTKKNLKCFGDRRDRCGRTKKKVIGDRRDRTQKRVQNVLWDRRDRRDRTQKKKFKKCSGDRWDRRDRRKKSLNHG